MTRNDPVALLRTPIVYHLTDATNRASIERHGLLSTSALLDLAGVAGPVRDQIERGHRPDRVILPNGVVLTDQKPMPAVALAPALHGMTPAEWYALLNARVFFWLDPERLRRQRRAAGMRPVTVFVVDVVRLLAAYGDHAAVTPINTGNARRRPAYRGAST